VASYVDDYIIERPEFIIHCSWKVLEIIIIEMDAITVIKQLNKFVFIYLLQIYNPLHSQLQPENFVPYHVYGLVTNKFSYICMNIYNLPQSKFCIHSSSCH
jgi:hypothetical protein